VAYRETIPKKPLPREICPPVGDAVIWPCVLEIEPQRGEPFCFENKIVGGVIPKEYIPAVEKGLEEAMEHG
jgi:elongation factor G